MMTRHAFTMLCAALLASLCAGSASAQALLQRCEKAITDATILVDQVGACSRALAKAKATPLQVPEDIKKEARTEPLFSRLIEYYAYSAYAANDGRVCDPVELLGVEGRACLRLAERALAAKKLFAPDAEFIENCKKDAVKPHETDAEDKLERTHGKDPDRQGVFKADRTVNVCPMIAEYRFRPVNEACSKWNLFAPDPASCRAYMAQFSGDDSACHNFKPDGKSGCRSAADCQAKRDACVDLALYGKAVKAKNIAVCGNANFCRVLMGAGPELTSKLASGFTSPAGVWFMNGSWKNLLVLLPKYASKMTPSTPPPAMPPVNVGVLPAGFTCAEPLFSPANQKAATAPINAARVCLSDIELALPNVDAETASGIDEREEKLARLGVRLDSYFGVGVAKPAPKAPAKSPARAPAKAPASRQ